jgi:poly(3-hydroxybutyrate) depolymerase
VTRREARQREALLDALRGVHRRERAPAALRQSVVERFVAPSRGRLRPSAWPGSTWIRDTFTSVLTAAPLRSASLALTALVLVAWVGGALAPGLLSGASPLRSSGSSGMPGGDQAVLTVGPEPSGESRRAPGSVGPATAAGARGSNDEPLMSEPGARKSQLAPDLQCPIFEIPSGAMIAAMKTDLDSDATGLALHTFDMETFSCGPVARRYLELAPRGVGSKSGAPVLIVLHDAGQSAEWARMDRRWHFDDVARREGFILVYANAAPGSATNIQIGNSGSWQGDARTHPEVDDEDYLQRIVADLVLRHVIDGNNDVYLAGVGGGARMALMAAARQPQAYAGVAAFMPPEAQTIQPPTLEQPTRLARVLIVLDAKSSLDATGALAHRWSRALGISAAIRQRFWTLASNAPSPSKVLQMDAAMPASGSAAVRLMVVDEPVAPFRVSPAGRQPMPDPDPSRPRAVDGARDAWAFLSGADGVEPMTPEANMSEEPAPNRLTADGVSVLPDDVTDDFADPPMVFDGDVVKVPTDARR